MSRHVLAARSGVVSSSTRPARRLWSSLSRTFDALISRTALAAGFWTSRPSRSRPRWSRTGYLRLYFEPLESRAMLSVNVSAPALVVEGDTFPVSFDSGNLPGTIVGYVAAFSDGTNVSLGPDATSVDHYFAQGPSDQSVAITAFDDLGNSDSGSASIHVNNIPPQLGISGDSSVGAGVFYALNLSATEAGPHYIQFWAINWGVGSPETIWGNPSGVSHQYMTPGTYTITVTAGDDTGVYSAGSQTVTVSATPPTLGISGPSWVNEGDVYTLGMNGTNGSGTISSWDLIWGDGSSPVNLPGNPSSAAHTYMVGPNQYTISASATDEYGTYDAGTLNVTVNNISPTVTLSGNEIANVGKNYVLQLGHWDPGGHELESWWIDWGDSQEIVSGAVSSLTHVYPVAGQYTITAAATEVDGMVGANSLNVDVEPVVITLSGPSTILDTTTYQLGFSVVDPAGTPISYFVYWGDGRSTFLNGQASSASHVYPAGAGTYSITVMMGDEYGQYTSDPLNVTVVAAPTLSIGGNSSDISQAEGHDGLTPFTFTVSLSEAISEAVTVVVATMDGTATVADSDYQALSQTVTFAPGETSKQVTVNVAGDRRVEDDETFQVVLSSASNAVISTSTATGTIVNDDEAPTANDDNYHAYYSATTNFVLTVAAEAGVLLNDVGYATLTVADFTQPAHGTISVDPDGGFEYTPEAGFSAATDSFTYRTSDGYNQSNWATVTIQVHAGPHFSVSDVTVLNADVTARFTVTYTPPETASGVPSYDPITIPWTTVDGTGVAGADYQSSNGTLTFYFDQLTKTVQVPILGTDSTDDLKTFYIDVGPYGPSGYGDSQYARGTGTIVNGDLDILDGNGTPIKEDEELDPGWGIMPHVPGENDMTRLVIRAVAGSPIGSVFHLQFDNSHVIVWLDTDATQPVFSDATNFDPGETTTVYVEAIPQANAADEEPWSTAIALAWFDPQTQTSKKADQVKANPTIIAFNAATMNGNQVGPELPDNLENAEGTFVPVNNDDDDYNGTPDVQDSGAIAGEGDLLPIYIYPVKSLTPNEQQIAQSKYILNVPGNVRVWRNADRSGAEVTNGTEFNANLSGVPNVQGGRLTLYVEGIAEGVGTLDLKWRGGKDGVTYPVGGAQIKVTTFGFHGPYNLPNYSTYTYYVTGAGNSSPQNPWSVPAGGALSGQQTAAGTDVKWGDGGTAGEVGRVEFAASTNYKWDMRVNVVKIIITDGTPSFDENKMMTNWTAPL